MDETYAVIMAGGAGTRFWPLSRRSRPKQLLALSGTGESLIGATVRRIRPLVPPERVLVVTNHALVDATRRALPDVPAENFLAEPVGRNTAPCIGWAASVVRQRAPDARLAVLPADHHIADESAFVGVLRTALAAAEGNALVTVGIPPTRPETGYGYVEMGEPVGRDVYRAARFVEKPDLAHAQTLVASGRHLWNSGMFFFRADAIVGAIEEHLPELALALRELATGGPARAAEVFPLLPSVSIDYGVMEKARHVLVVPGAFGWSDVGSWLTSWELAEHDGSGNALPAAAVGIDVEGCFVRAPVGKTVALVGLRDVVVVDTPDALLVIQRDRTQDVRAVVRELERRGTTERL